MQKFSASNAATFSVNRATKSNTVLEQNETTLRNQSKSSKKTAQKMKNIAYLVKFELLIVPAIVVAILIVKSASKLIIARDSAANTRGPHGIS